MQAAKPCTIRSAALALLETIEQYRQVNESAQSKLDAELKKRMNDLTSALAAPAFERLGQYVIDFATKLGWDPQSGEGAFEFVQRRSYGQGVDDARPYWARAYQESGDAHQDVATALATVERRVADGLATGKLPTA